jgi:hypothetical protein
MRDSDAPRFGWMPKLHVAALLGDLPPAVGLQRRENVSTVHTGKYTLMRIVSTGGMRINTHCPRFVKNDRRAPLKCACVHERTLDIERRFWNFISG